MRLEKNMELKKYDTDNEVFEIVYGQKIGLLEVLLTDAKQVRNNFEELPKAIRYQLFESQLIIYVKYHETNFKATFNLPL